MAQRRERANAELRMAREQTRDAERRVEELEREREAMANDYEGRLAQQVIYFFPFAIIRSFVRSLIPAVRCFKFTEDSE